jgi:hypothetical protein
MLTDEMELNNQQVTEVETVETTKMIAKKIVLGDEIPSEDDASDAEWMSEVLEEPEEDEDDDEFDEEMVIEDTFGDISAQMLDLDAPMEHDDREPNGKFQNS